MKSKLEIQRHGTFLIWGGFPAAYTVIRVKGKERIDIGYISFIKESPPFNFYFAISEDDIQYHDLCQINLESKEMAAILRKIRWLKIISFLYYIVKKIYFSLKKTLSIFKRKKEKKKQNTLF